MPMSYGRRSVNGWLLGALAAAAADVLPRAAFALEPEPAPLKSRVTIKVAVQERAGFMAPLQHVTPILDRLNIGYQQVNFQRYPDSRAAILSGAVDIGATGAAHIIQNLASGGEQLVGLRGLAAWQSYPIVRKGLQIETWQDLKGKKIGVGVGGNVWTTFVSKLNEVGVKYSDLNVIGIQGSGKNFNIALQRGDIDVSITWSPFSEMAVVEGIGAPAKALEFGNSQALGSEQGMWTTTRTALRQQSDLLERFLWAYAKAEEITNSSPEQKVATMVAFTGQPPEVAALIAQWTDLGSAISVTQMTKMAKLLFDLGVVQKDVSAEIPAHYDQTLAKKVRGPVPS